MLKAENLVFYLLPFTLHPLPFTLHPSPFTLYPLPFTLYPSPFTLHPSPFTLSYRSTSPSTMSMVPIHATTSAINRPSINLGKACKFANEGARTWQRKGFGEPSLTM